MDGTYLKVAIDANLIRRVGRGLAREARQDGGGNGPIHKAIHTACMIYMGFTRERYIEQSRGGGDWPPLAPSTIASRRKGRNTQGAEAAETSAAIFQAQGVPAGEASILIDTATLLGSLGSGQARTESVPAGVRVGTVVEYAKYHQFGDGVPKREIMVDPDMFTLALIEQALTRGYQQSVNRIESEG